MTKMTETTYRVIGFGANKHGFFNQFNWVTTAASANNEYQNLIADPEMDGAVMIEVKHEDWKVVKEFFTYPVKVVCGPLGNFKVEQIKED